MAHDIPIEILRFRQIRQELNLTQQAFADALKIKGSIADIERGKSRLSGALVATLLQLYKINPLWLYGESEQKFLSAEGSALPKVVTLDASGNENIVMIPVKASAGYAHNVQDPQWYDTLPSFGLPLPEYRNATFRAFQVAGDSMLPALRPGEWVLAQAVERLPDTNPNDLFVFVLPDTVVVKRFVVEGEILQLLSLNTAYPDILTPVSDVREIWKVSGKITTHFDAAAYDLELLAREMRDAFDDLKRRIK